MDSFKSKIELINYLSTLDWIIFSIVILATVFAVIYGQIKKASAEESESESFLDLLIMGRQLTLPLFIGTLVATWYGGIFGVTQISFEKGIYNFVTQGFFWYIAYIIFALFLVDRIAPFKALTLPDLIGKMFGPKSSYLAGVFNFFNVLPIAYTISLGYFIKLLFGFPLLTSMMIGTFFVLLYSLWGGLRAVVFSDFVQFFVMCLGVFLIVVFSVNTFGGLEFLRSSLPSTHFELTGGETLATTFVWGFIALSTLVDPNFYQRCFAAKDSKTAKKGILLSTFVWFCFDICTTLGGMYAKAVIPEANSGDAYLTYAVQVLPSGIRGFVLAGILATILSTLDSYLFLAGTTLSFDLVPKKFKGKVWLHHIGVLSVAIISIIMAVSFDGNIKKVWKTLGSYSASCLLFPVLFGYLFPGRIKDKHFLFSSLLGVIGVTYWRNTEHSGFAQNIDELYIGLLLTCLGLFYSLWAFKKDQSSCCGTN